MEYIDFPVLNQHISRLGFGCCPMGQHAWGHTDENQLITAVKDALKNGINFFDTADIYGFGRSETILGKALGKKRHQAIIASKFGVRVEKNRTFYDNSSAWIKKAVEGSLSRLGTDYIDLYQLHNWDRTTPISEIFDELEKLRNEGKIRAFGVTNVDLVENGFSQNIEGLVSFSYEYSLATRKFEFEILKTQKKLNLCFLSWGSLGQGIFSGKYSEKTKFEKSDRRRKPVYTNFHGEKLIRNLQIVEFIRSILPHYENKALPQMAVRWILDQIPLSIALVGTKRSSQLICNIGALNWKLSEEHRAKLKELSNFSLQEPPQHSILSY